jgi:hypothetical protein
MSFGQWYEDQKNGNASSSAVSDEENGFLPLFTSAMNSLPSSPPDLGWNSIKSNLEAQMPQTILGMNYHQRFKVFCGLILLSALFFALGFFVGLPMMAVRPQKFALSFTFGSLTFMSSFAILRGPEAHFTSMFHPDRLLFTVVYLSSMFMTLYCTFRTYGPKAYVLVMGCSILQIMALLWYLVTFLPGGSQGLKMLLHGVLTMIRPIIVGLSKCFASCVLKVFGS